jgi:hypothetical protein
MSSASRRAVASVLAKMLLANGADDCVAESEQGLPTNRLSETVVNSACNRRHHRRQPTATKSTMPSIGRRHRSEGSCYAHVQTP